MGADPQSRGALHEHVKRRSINHIKNFLDLGFIGKTSVEGDKNHCC